MKSNFTRQPVSAYTIAGLLVLLSVPGLNTSLFAQSGSYGNTFVSGGAETAVFGTHSFRNGGAGTLPGIVLTTRTSPQGYFSFAAGSGTTGTANNAHVNGYVKKYGATAFTFPVGDGTAYRPLITPVQSASTVLSAAYFSTNPSSATLPAGAPFPATNLGAGVSGVSSVEYWDLDGTLATTVVLTWNAASNLNTLTGGSAAGLIVAGYNPATSKWENLGQAALTGTVSTAGTITSSLSFVPNTYSALTFGTMAMITANPDAGTASSGTGGTAIADVTANDLVNGVAATPANSTITLVSASPGIILNTATGSVSVAIGTTPGTYTLTYQLCDKLTPPTCATAAATIVVAPVITASPDAGSASAGTGGTAVANVRANDLVNGSAATSANSSLSVVSSGSPGITLNAGTGSVSVAVGTAPGTYTLVYSLCSTLGSTTCTTSYATVTVNSPDLVVSIGQPSPALVVGQTSTVPVSISNVGTAPTNGPLSFTLSIPAGVPAPATFTNNGFSCATSGTLVACNSSTPLTNGASTTVLVPLTPLAASAGTSPVLSGTVATGNESNPNNNTTTTTVTPAVVAPDLTTSIGAPAPALLAGQASTVPLMVSNFGTFSTTGPVTATLVIPATFTAPASFTDNGFSCTTTGSVIACSSTGVISTGSSALINIPVTPGIAAVGSQTFTATAATPNESNTANNGSTRVENPLAPTVSITSPASVTTTLTTTISGTATPNSTVVLTGPVGTTLCTTTASATGSYSCLVTLPAGPVTVTAAATNIGGSSTPATTSFTAVAPASVTVTSPVNVTTTLVPTVSGSATPGSTVTITGPGPTVLCTTTASASGTFACPVSVPAGPNTLTVTASGPGGSSTRPITFTAVAPPTVSIISPRNGLTTATPTISGTATPGSRVVLTGPGNVTLCITTASASGTYACSVSLTATGPQTVTAVATSAAGVSIPATTTFTVSIFAIRVRVLLQGPLIGTAAGAGIMRDDVRRANLIPLTEPYSGASFTSSFTHVGGGGGETTTSAVLSVSSATDAIVDWVFIELRDPTNPARVLYSRSALVQRDGDVVDVDGVSPLSFTATSNAYYVAVRHRNHLGAMASGLMVLNGTVVTVDFTDPSLSTYGTYARQVVSGKAALWAGNSNYAPLSQPRQTVIYQGTGNDVSRVLNDVLADPGNTGGPGGSALATYIAPRYATSDLDMDGKVIYQGASNDIRVVFATVLLYPGNSLTLITYIVSEQLP